MENIPSRRQYLLQAASEGQRTLTQFRKLLNMKKFGSAIGTVGNSMGLRRSSESEGPSSDTGYDGLRFSEPEKTRSKEKLRRLDMNDEQAARAPRHGGWLSCVSALANIYLILNPPVFSAPRNRNRKDRPARARSAAPPSSRLSTFSPFPDIRASDDDLAAPAINSKRSKYALEASATRRRDADQQAEVEHVLNEASASAKQTRGRYFRDEIFSGPMQNKKWYKYAQGGSRGRRRDSDHHVDANQRQDKGLPGSILTETRSSKDKPPSTSIQNKKWFDNAQGGFRGKRQDTDYKIQAGREQDDLQDRKSAQFEELTGSAMGTEVILEKGPIPQEQKIVMVPVQDKERTSETEATHTDDSMRHVVESAQAQAKLLKLENKSLGEQHKLISMESERLSVENERLRERLRSLFDNKDQKTDDDIKQRTNQLFKSVKTCVQQFCSKPPKLTTDHIVDPEDRSRLLRVSPNLRSFDALPNYFDERKHRKMFIQGLINLTITESFVRNLPAPGTVPACHSWDHWLEPDVHKAMNTLEDRLLAGTATFDYD